MSIADAVLASAVLAGNGWLTFLLLRPRRDAEKVYETGLQDLVDAGFLDGTRVGRPVVVAFRETG